MWAVTGGGEGVADLHDAIRDDDPVDQQFDQEALLVERRLGQPGPHLAAECLQAVRDSLAFYVLCCLGV